MIVAVLLLVLSMFVDGWPWQCIALAVIAGLELGFELLALGSA